MSWFQTLILGLLQGLTEFLPVSSSGHLEIGYHLFNLDAEGANNLTFTIAVHAATVLSTLFVFRKEIIEILAGFFKFKYNEETKFVFQIVISMIPVAIVGLFFKDSVEALFENGIIYVGLALLVTAALLIMSQMVKKTDKEINYWRAFVIGISQALAIIPGLSRSGSTIATGLLLGVKRENVAKFSFLMVIVPVLGESFLDLVKGGFSVTQSGIDAFPLLVGFLAAFGAGVFACRAMISLVQRSKLHYFAIYCMIVGMIVIANYLF